MIGMENLHRHSPTALSTSNLAIMNPLVLPNLKTVPDSYSSSSESTSACETTHMQKSKTLNQSDSVCNSSSVGETSSSAASSFDLIYFSPTKEREKTQTPDQGISLTTSTASDPDPFSRPNTATTTKDSEIDEFMLRMLNSAKELTTFSLNDCSRSSSTSGVMSKSLQIKLNEKNEEPYHHHPQSSNNIFPSKSQNIDKDGSPSPDLSTKVSVDQSSNISEVDSLIKELDEAPSTHCNRPQGGTPKFLKMDDQYTTNNYVSIIRTIAEKQTKKRSKDDALNRTSSWAEHLTSNPPPLPVTSIPSTPIMSRYRIMNSSMKISPDHFERNETPTSTKSADNTDGYFFHQEKPIVNGLQKKFSNFASKLVHHQRFKPMSLKMNHPSSENNSEASLTRSEINERQVATLDGPLVMRNAAFYANSTCPSTPRNHDFTFINRSNEKSITVSRIDELLNYDSDYLYDIQSADKLQIVHELAFHEILTYVERSASLRIKEWGLKLEVIQNIKNKFSRPQTSAPIVKNRLFGMPLFMIQAQNGNGCPFPKFIMDIMEYLKETAIDVDGIFRRCGSQKRIQEMREICDSLSCHDSLPEEFKTVNFINELSDLLKLYLRTLPQKLVPESITEIVTSAISANPPEKHLHIMKLMVLILPGENRDALLVFLDFLFSISKNSVNNLMTVDNLSICTMPTVFTLSDISQSATPNRRRKTVAIMNGKDAMPYTSLKLALSLLISHRSELDTIPPYILKAANMKNPKKKKDLKDSMAPLQDIGVAASLRCFVAQLFKENDEYWKSWRIEFIHENGILISTREVDDPCALKSCRLQLTVQASPKQVVSALINHSEKWDLITTSTKATFIDFSNKEDIANITYKNFNNAAIKRSTVARIWEDDEPGTGKAYLAQKTCKSDPLSSNVHIYHTAFIICPFKEKSVINYVNRIDLKGKPADWYDKTYRQLLISQMNCLASLFKNK